MTETSRKASVRGPLLALAAVTIVVVLDENRANLFEIVHSFCKDYGCSWILNPGWHDLLARRFQGVEVFTKTLNYRFTAT